MTDQHEIRAISATHRRALAEIPRMQPPAVVAAIASMPRPIVPAGLRDAAIIVAPIARALPTSFHEIAALVAARRIPLPPISAAMISTPRDPPL